MPEQIAPGVLVYSREEWGADASLPRLGAPIPPGDRTEAILHHYAALDYGDDSPNLWESVAECKVAMRGLQTARAADLGADIPYSDVAFLMAASFRPARLLLMEGRGFHRRGAHTKYHNRTGYAVALAANTQNPVRVVDYVDELSACYGRAKGELPNLGTVTPERGGVVHGHRDFRREDDRSTWTVCPGRYAMNAIDQITIGDPLMSIEGELRDLIREVEKQMADLTKAVEKQTAKGDAIDRFQTAMMAYNYRVNGLQQAWMQLMADQHALDEGASPADRTDARAAVTSAAADLAKAIEEQPEPPNA